MGFLVLCEFCWRVPFTQQIFMFMFFSPQPAAILHPEACRILGILNQIVGFHTYLQCHLVSILAKLSLICPSAISKRETEFFQPQFISYGLFPTRWLHTKLVFTVWQCLSPILSWHWGPSFRCAYIGLASINNMISELTSLYSWSMEIFSCFGVKIGIIAHFIYYFYIWKGNGKDIISSKMSFPIQFSFILNQGNIAPTKVI